MRRTRATHSAGARLCLIGLLAGFVAGLFVGPAVPGHAQDYAAPAAQPIKHYILIDLAPSTDVLVLDRWYLDYHAPETLERTRRAQTRYVSYRTYSMPEQQRSDFRAVRGRMTEIGFDSLATFQSGFTAEARARVQITERPDELRDAMEVISVTIPDRPDTVIEDSVDPKAASQRDKPYFRWILFVAYPEGADEEVGNLWLEQLAMAVARRADVPRALLYRGVRESNPYQHVVEIWFDDRVAWEAAAPEIAGLGTPWGSSLLELDIRSAFIGERPDLDFKSRELTTP